MKREWMQLGGSRNAAHYLKEHPQNLRKPRSFEKNKRSRDEGEDVKRKGKHEQNIPASSKGCCLILKDGILAPLIIH